MQVLNNKREKLDENGGKEKKKKRPRRTERQIELDSKKELEDRKKREELETKLAIINFKNRKEVPRWLVTKLDIDNALFLCRYTIAHQNEAQIIEDTRANNLKLLINLVRYIKEKTGRLVSLENKELTPDDITLFLERLRKTDDEDPLHKWQGRWNYELNAIRRFVKWVYYPEHPNNKVKGRNSRPIPEDFKRIPFQIRKEKTIYSEKDMWDEDEIKVYLKYESDSRLRVFVSVQYDVGARPIELLKAKIGDIHFQKIGERVVATISINSKKTGNRQVVLINSIPYLRDFLATHPQKDNEQAYIFYKKWHFSKGTPYLSELRLNYMMSKSKLKFRYYLKSGEIALEDREIVERLVKKPWNPYFLRHIGLTKKASELTDSELRQWAGWVGNSEMPRRYIHLQKSQAVSKVLIKNGIVENDKKENVDLVRQCPMCKRENTSNSKFCTSCGMVMSYEEYRRTKEEGDRAAVSIEMLTTLLKERPELATQFVDLLIKTTKERQLTA